MITCLPIGRKCTNLRYMRQRKETKEKYTRALYIHTLHKQQDDEHKRHHSNDGVLSIRPIVSKHICHIKCWLLRWDPSNVGKLAAMVRPIVMKNQLFKGLKNIYVMNCMIFYFSY
eukprot:TRINITY_DN21594_c0_g1_i1.p1 TRINITY_DN21594_c0_g1~~TRINITY_DN21594_c0_g1_i1.p1  ORF type:complete len:115 (+),score=3.92 TRINITY_DN21594_c0_g1_i1:27-371(+)